MLFTHSCNTVRDNAETTSIKIVYFSRPPNPCSSTSKIFNPLGIGRPIFNEPLPSHPLQQTMEQQPHCACERTRLKQKQNQVTSHSNWLHILLFTLVSLKDGFTVWHQS